MYNSKTEEENKTIEDKMKRERELSNNKRSKQL